MPRHTTTYVGPFTLCGRPIIYRIRRFRDGGFDISWRHEVSGGVAGVCDYPSYERWWKCNLAIARVNSKPAPNGDIVARHVVTVALFDFLNRRGIQERVGVPG